LVNQGDAGPQDSQIENLYFLSWDSNAFEALGVQGDKNADTTNFCYGVVSFGVYVENCTSWSATDDGYYIRNAVGLSLKNSNDAYSAGTGLYCINCKGSGLSFSIFASDVTWNYDSTDPNGKAHGTQTGLYIRLSDVHSSVVISNEGKGYLNNSRARGVVVGGSGSLKVYISHIELACDLNGTVSMEFFNGFIEDDLTAEGGVTFDFANVHCEGDVTLAAGAGACTMDGGRIMGTLTANGRLTHTQGDIGT
jgi:hypothetical protein